MKLLSLFKTEPPGAVRPRKFNPAPDNRQFQTPRANMLNDNQKPKHVIEGKLRPQEPKILKVESKPLQRKAVIQKTKIINKEIIHQIVNNTAKQELKRLVQRTPAGVKKLVLQKKKLITALKAKASPQNLIPLDDVEETPVTMPVKKITKVSNVQVQKIKPEEKSTADQKPKPLEKATAPEKAKVENDTSILNNKAKEKTATTSIITRNNNTQDVKSEEDTKTDKTVPEVAQKAIPANQEKELQDVQKDDKVSTANSVENQNKNQAKTEVSPGEKYELDPLLARAVEEELQDIMIQVWQELPDDPLEEEDRIAVEKLRNEASDDLRRVLGLNITKRLLNVYNNLFIKMEFTCRPQMGCLTSFLNEYHISKFKRINKNSNTFAAQMETIEDYDKLCAMKEITCGEAKISVTPCYKFNQCPENLKTIYDDTYFYEDAAQVQAAPLKSKNNTQKGKLTASNGNIVKPIAKVENNVESSNKSENPEVQKTANAARNESGNNRKDPVTVDKQKTNDSPKTVTENNKSKEKEVTHNITNEKEILKDIAKDKNAREYITQDNFESDNDKDFESEVPEYQTEGEEELDDEDILALMSEGVVLDECSGSEDEN